MGRFVKILAGLATLAIVAASGASIYSSVALAQFRGDRFFVGNPLRAYANFACHEARLDMDWHCAEDWNVINSSSETPLGYASFDARPTLNSTTPEGHFVGFQSRPLYNGTDLLGDYFDGVNVKLGHTGSGVVGSASGFRVMDPTGSGPITNLIGLFVERQTRGMYNSGIVSQNSRNYLAGVQTDDLSVAATLALPRKSIDELSAFEGQEGSLSFGSDACKPYQAPPNCDGAPVYWSAGAWRTFHDGKSIRAED